MKRILLLGTGGTIACKRTEDGLKPVITSEEILSYVPDSKSYCQIDSLQLLNIDSTNIEPKHWISIADAIETHYEEYDGFVITHGTDTLAYTASALSYLIQNSPKPIVLTGAQKPIDMENTDARTNLSDSLRFAACDRAHNVNIVFDGKVIAGTRGKKERTKSYNAEHFEAVIIESFGVGGLPSYERNDYRSAVSKWTSQGKTVIMATQVTNEGSNMSVYEVGKNIKQEFGLLEAYDMTLEAAVTKIMWILGQTKDPEEIRALFYKTVNRDILWKSSKQTVSAPVSK